MLIVNRHTFPSVVHNSGMAKTFGQRLKELREARKLTQDQVAQAVGIKQGSFTQLETGKSKRPSSVTLTRLGRYFEVDPEWLLTGKGQQTPVETFSEAETELILLFRALSKVGQDYILGRAKAIHLDEHQLVPRSPRKPSDPDRPQPDENGH